MLILWHVATYLCVSVCMSERECVVTSAYIDIMEFILWRACMVVTSSFLVDCTRANNLKWNQTVESVRISLLLFGLLYMCATTA